MLDYKNNTQEHFENIDKYIKSLEDEKEILLNAIRTLKGKTPLQGSLFDEYNDFIELAAYEVDDILSAGEKPYSLSFKR